MWIIFRELSAGLYVLGELQRNDEFGSTLQVSAVKDPEIYSLKQNPENGFPTWAKRRLKPGMESKLERRPKIYSEAMVCRA
jgi:hypothetical protein